MVLNIAKKTRNRIRVFSREKSLERAHRTHRLEHQKDYIEIDQFLKKFKCLVCESESLEVLTRMVSAYSPQLLHKVVICKKCGHIQMHPLFSETEYSKINAKFFNRKYLIAGNLNTDNLRKISRLDKRLSSYLKPGLKVLDVGAGEGWAMNYFQKKRCHYFAIEPIDRLAESLKNRGCRIIGKSLFEDYPEFEQYFDTFDLVIFRHALEHMLNPANALKRLKCFLKEESLLYLVVPNASTFSVKKGFRTSFLRPVHISYFCEGNLVRLAESVELSVVTVQSDSEIFVLLRRGEEKTQANHNYYTTQKDLFKRIEQETLMKDTFNSIKIIKRRIFH